MRLFQLVLLALCVSRIDADPEPYAPGRMPLDHLSQPFPKFLKRGNHSYDALLPQTVDKAFAGIKWTKNATENTNAFNAAMSVSRFKTLAQVIDAVMPSCGVTSMGGKAVNVSDMTTMVWQNDKTHEGFRYHGPCEAWIDSLRVFQSPDCRVNRTDFPASIPIDYSVCKTECMFKFYWLAVDIPELKTYKQCARIATRLKALRRFEQLLKAKGDSPLLAKLNELKKRKATDSTNDAGAKNDTKQVDKHEPSDDKTKPHTIVDTKNNTTINSHGTDDLKKQDRNDSHTGDKSEVKRDKKGDSGGSYDHRENHRHNRTYDVSHAPRPRNNSHPPTPSPTTALNPTYTIHIHLNCDSADDKSGEMEDNDENKHAFDDPCRHSYIHEETVASKHALQSTITSTHHRGEDLAIGAKQDEWRNGHNGSDDNSVASTPHIYLPTPSPTQATMDTRVPLYLRHQDASDKQEDSNNEKMDIDEHNELTRRRRDVLDEIHARNTRDDAQHQGPPPAYAIYLTSTSLVILLPIEELTSPLRAVNDDNIDSRDDNLAVNKGDNQDDDDGDKDHDASGSGEDNRTGSEPTQLQQPSQYRLQQQEAPRRTTQPPFDHQPPTRHLPSALPRHS